MTTTDHDRLQRWVRIDRAPEEVWAEIGDFGKLSDWHPWIAETEQLEIDGEPHRHLKTIDGQVFLERLLDRGAHHYTYRTIDGPLPLDDHRATLSCVAEPGGCHVFWSAYFVPTDRAADDMVIGFYEAGLNALRERFEEEAGADPQD